MLLFLFVGFVLACNRVVLLELKFIRVLFLVLSSVVDMALSGSRLFVARRHEFYEFIL